MIHAVNPEANRVIDGWPGRQPGILDAIVSRYESDDVLLTIFMPVLNEEPNVVPSIEQVVAAATELGISYEILVFDDASTDGTVEVVKQFMAKHPTIPVRLVAHKVRRGVARNYVDGAFLGRGKYYRFTSGDNVESKETFIKIISSIGKADIIVPYAAETYGRSWKRMLLSKTFTFAINMISGRSLHYYNGGAVYRRVHVMRWHVDTGGFSFQAEFLTRVLDLGLSYLEIPVVANERQFGVSKAISSHNFFSAAYCLSKILAWRLRSLLFG